LFGAWCYPPLTRKRSTEEKLKNFEWVFSFRGQCAATMAVKYFLIAILFVLFDVEVIFLSLCGEFPWNCSGVDLAQCCCIAFSDWFIYIIAKGALQWED
jgi:NADH-quinone oxidoreductase subunit A